VIVAAIILAGLVIALAAPKLHEHLSSQKKGADALAMDAAAILKKAMEEKKYSAAAMPGLEGKISALTANLDQFETIVDPVVDLGYAKKLTGEIPSTVPPGVTEPEISEEALAEGQGLSSMLKEIPLSGLTVKSYSTADPESAAETLAGQGKTGITALALAHTPGIIAEAASFGQMESVIWTVMDLVNASGLPDIVKASNLLPYEIAVLTPAKYHYNRVFKPVQPAAKDLPLMLVRGLIDDEEYLQLMSYQGHDGRWAADYLNISYRIPGFRELQFMRWRGLIDDVGFKLTLAQQGWHPNVLDEMLNLAWLIPGPDDLIRFVVREVIPPSDFITWMSQQGFGPGWAGAYWTAHFRLPGPADLIEAFHRKLINEAELRKYIFWHDYNPDLRPDIHISDIDIYKGLTKTLIPRVDLRRAWAQGGLTDPQLVERYEYLGYEDDAELMAEIQKTIALTPQRGALVSIYMAALRKGVKTESEVRTKLKALKVPMAAITMLIEAEDVRRAIGMVEPNEEARILSTSQVLAAYKKGLFAMDVTREILVGQGWDPGAADTLIALNTPPPEEERPVSQVRTAAAALYREGWMSSEEFEGRLRAANYSEDDIATIRAAEDLRYRLDYLKDLEDTAIQAYRKDVYTAEELEAYLITLGKAPVRIRPLVAKEIFKKLPKGAAA